MEKNAVKWASKAEDSGNKEQLEAGKSSNRRKENGNQELGSWDSKAGAEPISILKDRMWLPLWLDFLKHGHIHKNLTWNGELGTQKKKKKKSLFHYTQIHHWQVQFLTPILLTLYKNGCAFIHFLSIEPILTWICEVFQGAYTHRIVPLRLPGPHFKFQTIALEVLGYWQVCLNILSV